MRWGKKSKLIVVMLFLFFISLQFIWAGEQTTRGEVVSLFKSVQIPSDTMVRGNVVSIFGDVEMKGEVTGDVVAIFGRINVEGIVQKDVISILGGITVGPKAIINGSTVAVLGYGIDHQGGMIRKDTISVIGIAPKNMAPMGMFLVILFVLMLLKQVFAFIISAAAVLLLPERFNRMAHNIQLNAGKKVLIGLLVYLSVFVIGSILILTVIGVPLLMLLIPALIILEILGNTTAKVALGRIIAGKLGKKWTILMELLIGTFIYILLKISIIGNIFTFAFKLTGLGEVIDSRFGEGNKKDA
jgi:hypothetical protein